MKSLLKKEVDNNRLRCIPDGMGCNMSEPADWRSMVTDTEQQAHKLPGVSGYNISSPDIPERQNQDVSTPPVGQHHSSGIHQWSPRFGRPSEEPVDVVPGKEYISTSQPNTFPVFRIR